MSSYRTVRITVRGRLSDRLAASFSGMRVTHCNGTTELVGPLVDQAQLHGLITRVRDLGLELESVRVLEHAPTSPARRRPRPTHPASSGT